MDGLQSLLNESTLSYKRGDRVRFIDRFGKEQRGKYVMASSADGYIVLNMGGQHGRPQVVHINSIIK